MLIFFGSYLSITGSIYGLFDKAGKVLKKEARDYIAIWLMGADLPAEKNWPSMFAALFDRVFTEKHLSWRCFLRSSVASVVVISLTVAAVDASILEDLFEEGIFFTVSLLVFASLIFNLLPDYLSLYETRLVLGFMAKSDGGLRVLLLLVFDLAATALISFVVGFVVIWGLVFIISGSPRSVTETAEVFWHGAPRRKGPSWWGGDLVPSGNTISERPSRSRDTHSRTNAAGSSLRT